MTHHYDLYAIGNALVDSEYEVSDAQLQAMGVEKRHMTLIDAPRRTDLLAHVQGLHARRTGGGSAGNTVVALAQLGDVRGRLITNAFVLVSAALDASPEERQRRFEERWQAGGLMFLRAFGDLMLNEQARTTCPSHALKRYLGRHRQFERM